MFNMRLSRKNQCVSIVVILMISSFLVSLLFYYKYNGKNVVHSMERFFINRSMVPADVKFFGKGGMRAETYSRELVHEILEYHPHYVFMTIGGNDITHKSQLKEIVKFIDEIVKEFLDSGVRRVFFTEIGETGKFKKDPKLNQKCFNVLRREINAMMQKKENVGVIKIRSVYPQHYDTDCVHYNDTGYKKYFYDIRKVIFSLKL